jgi:hypothetical protein
LDKLMMNLNERIRTNDLNESMKEYERTSEWSKIESEWSVTLYLQRIWNQMNDLWNLDDDKEDAWYPWQL